MAGTRDDDEFFDAPDTLLEQPMVPERSPARPDGDTADHSDSAVAADGPVPDEKPRSESFLSPKWFTITNLDTGEVISIDQADSVIPPSPFLQQPADSGGSASPVTEDSRSVAGTASGKDSPADGVPRRGRVLQLVDELMRRIRRSKKPESESSDTSQHPDGWTPVHVNKKLRQELTDLCQVQKFRAHSSAVWVAKFSKCGRFLATAGQDMVLRVWRVAGAAVDADEDGPLRASVDAESASAISGRESSDISAAGGTRTVDRAAAATVAAAAAAAPAGALAAGGAIDLADTDGLFEAVPYREYRGHQGDIFDVAWSTSNFILTGSMDNTVRLWHIRRPECLCVFQHVDFVTTVDFHPLDERFFLSGSFDEKIRIWAIPENKVVHWTKARGLVTAAAFTRDGGMVMCGLYTGLLCFYQTEGLRFMTQIQVRSSRGKNAKGRKITGLQLTPDGEHVLVTSNDSRLRMYSLTNYTQVFKYAGLANDNSPIRGALSDSGDYVICASEDKRVFIWNRIGPNDVESRSRFRSDRNEYYESFNVGDAVPTSALFVPGPAVAAFTANQMRRLAAELATPVSALPAAPVAAAAAASAAAPAGGAGTGPAAAAAEGTTPGMPRKASDTLAAAASTPSIASAGSRASPRAGVRSKEALVGAMVLVADYAGEVRVLRNTGYPKQRS